jgi:hypothetical protein
MTNDQHIEHARFAIASACWARGESPAYDENAITDLLADLRHYCAAHGLDYDRCDRVATMHFQDESAEGAS